MTKLKDVNVCKQESLSRLFGMVNQILVCEQRRAEKFAPNLEESKDGKSNFNASSNTFMYRSDIKEMILLLFALCEYNLKIVFSQGFKH